MAKYCEKIRNDFVICFGNRISISLATSALLTIVIVEDWQH